MAHYILGKIKSKFNKIYGPGRDRFIFPYKVLNLQLVMNSITKHSLLAWATCDKIKQQCRWLLGLCHRADGNRAFNAPGWKLKSWLYIVPTDYILNYLENRENFVLYLNTNSGFTRPCEHISCTCAGINKKLALRKLTV